MRGHEDIMTEPSPSPAASPDNTLRASWIRTNVRRVQRDEVRVLAIADKTYDPVTTRLGTSLLCRSNMG